MPPSRFDSELTQALEEAENEREQKDKVFQENSALGTEIYTLRHSLQVRKPPLFLFFSLFNEETASLYFIKLVRCADRSSAVVLLTILMVRHCYKEI